MRSNNPALRFKSKGGSSYPDWAEVKLGDIAEIIMGQSPESKNYTDENKYSVLVQGNADIKNGKIMPRVYTKEVTKLCEVDDILMTVRAPVGELAIADIQACIGRGVCAIRYNKFIFYFLEKFNFIEGWNSFSTGTTFEAVNSNSIRELSLFSPCLEEQEKIAAFFSEIDSTIELEEKLLSNMKLHKTGMMQRMFSKSGESPEVRFKDSKGAEYPDWAEVKLGDILIVPEKEKIISSNNKKLLTIQLHCKGIRENTSLKIRLTEKGRPYYYRHCGELIIGRQNFHNGSIAILPKKFDNGVMSNAISSFKIKNNINNIDFLYYFISRPYYYESIGELYAGTGQKEITEKNILKLNIFAPCLEEQEKIAGFFSELDINIKNKEQKIKNIKEYKKGLMQKMFV